MVSADAVPWIVQVVALEGGAVPQSGLWAWTPVPGVRFLGSEAAQAVSAPSDRGKSAAAGVVGEATGGASTAQMSLCPARSLVKVIWVPSGDHAGSVSQSGWLLTLMGSPLPSAFLTKISPFPSKPRVLSKAILVPSGEMEGCSSVFTEGVAVSWVSLVPSASMR